jgi:hypothetical protein
VSSADSRNSTKTLVVAANVVEARSRRGSVSNRPALVSRLAVEINRVAISTWNRSSASSTACSSKALAAASSVAVCRGSASCPISGAFEVNP